MARGRRRTGLALGLVAGVVALGATAAAAVGFGGASPGTAASGTLPRATARVTRMTLQDTESVDGTLGYGDETAVGTRLGGIITALPATGTVIDRGQALFQVDAQPVVLMYGTEPLYRPLIPGASGADVREFEQNLAALGYTGFTVDDDYTSSTASAVRRWQSDLGLPRTGRVDPGRVVFAAQAVRVATLTGQAGDPASGRVLTYTGTVREVTVPLDVAKQELAKIGAAATITLPDNTTVAGKVDTVGTVARRQGPDPDVAATQSTTIEVTVSIADQGKLGTLDQAPVTVALVSDERRNVLTVPVAALLALAEGGYGVQVVDGSTSRIVAVRVGLFADGRVEVTGDGIHAGTVVGVPQ